MAEDNLFYVDITGMIKASGLGKAVLNNINDCLLSYVTSSEYGVSEEYDISDINDSKRRTISSEISSFLKDLNMIILIFAREKRKVLERLEEYRRLGYLDVPDYGDPNNPTIGVIGNSYYYYEGYPEMLKGFYNNDVNIDVAISSRIGLEMQKELLEAAAKGDKEEFNRLFREYIIEQFDKDKRYDDITKEMKKFESTCMTDYNIQDGEPTSIVWEGYRRMADPNRKQDAVVIEGMGLDENKEALRDITNMMLGKNDKMVIIIDDYGDHTEEEQKEMTNIINLMLSDENNRPNTQYLYYLIMEEYIKNVAKITSIDSVFRCMISFMAFCQNIMQKQQIMKLLVHLKKNGIMKLKEITFNIQIKCQPILTLDKLQMLFLIHWDWK